MSKEATYRVHEADDGSWYWTLVASNGEILSSSETFTREQDANRSVAAAKRAAAEAAEPDAS